MGSLLQSTRNTRVLPTGTMRYIRSDVPENLTDKEIQWLLDHHVTTIVDLRSEEECVRKPCCLKGRVPVFSSSGYRRWRYAQITGTSSCGISTDDR